MTEELKEQFECSGGENTEKYINFSVPIEKETENIKTVTYKITFIDSVRFMASSYSSLGDNITKGLHNSK